MMQHIGVKARGRGRVQVFVQFAQGRGRVQFVYSLLSSYGVRLVSIFNFHFLDDMAGRFTDNFKEIIFKKRWYRGRTCPGVPRDVL